MSDIRCDLYQNPYKTHCSGSISPDLGGDGLALDVCWRHLAQSRDEWMRRAQRAEAAVKDYDRELELALSRLAATQNAQNSPLATEEGSK